MTNTVKVESGAHVAYLDAMRGAGLLVKPDPATNVHVEHEGLGGLHAADWDRMMRRLAADGWTLFVDDYDLPTDLARLDNNRVVYGLYPVIEDASPLTEAEDNAYKVALSDLVGQIPD